MEVEEELPEPWNLFTNKSSYTDGSRAGLVLTNPEGMEFTYALRFKFDTINNKAEYEALIAGLRIAEQTGEIILDNGKQFRDNPFKDWCEKLRIRQHFAFVKHPQTNGLVERANCNLREGMNARLNAKSKNWMEELPHSLWAHRTMIKSSNGDTPLSLTYRTEAVIPAKIGMPTLRTAEVDLVQNNEALGINLDLLEEKREDLVYRNNDASHAKDTGKLGPKWEGPYEVTEALAKGAYKLRDHDEKQLLRT
nr:reverse transcriptase domain-containing protein [Tanacetum cinerariifolium]